MRFTKSLRQLILIVSHHSWTRVIFGTALVVSGTALANRFTSAACFVQPAGTYACRQNGFNPSTYNVCRLVDSTCTTGEPLYTLVIMPPPNWPRCTTWSIATFPKNITEQELACGTTQWFLDKNCSMYCDPTNPGAWVACRAAMSQDPCF